MPLPFLPFLKPFDRPAELRAGLLFPKSCIQESRLARFEEDLQLCLAEMVHDKIAVRIRVFATKFGHHQDRTPFKGIMIHQLRRNFLGVGRLGKQALKQGAFGFSLRKLGTTLGTLQGGGFRVVAARDADLGQPRSFLLRHAGRVGKRLEQLQLERRR